MTMSDAADNRAPRNRTIVLTDEERCRFETSQMRLDRPASLDELGGRTICQDIYEALAFLPSSCVDLLFADPPYNQDKTFNGRSFARMSLPEYEVWLESWLRPMARVLKANASVYICGDWRSSSAIHRVCQGLFKVRNRITWEREKGRGAETNWKNCSEDIWFCTVGDQYTFNVRDVKLKRRVLAPYTDTDGKPKDWDIDADGRFRLTYPSNLWTDLTVPFWSMPENTAHPTQKPEKLLAKLILASSNPGDVVFDPFLGSGTCSVVAKKLGRRYFGLEIDPYYACLTQKRLELADTEVSIQGYRDGVFWERNSGASLASNAIPAARPALFEDL